MSEGQWRGMRDINKERDDFDRDFKKVQKLGIVWFIICAIISLIVLGVGVWAVVAIVSWLTSK